MAQTDVKIRAKVSFAGLSFSAIPGQVLNLPLDTAMDLVRAGYAEVIQDEDKRDNAGSDTKSVKGKRAGVKRS